MEPYKVHNPVPLIVGSSIGGLVLLALITAGLYKVLLSLSSLCPLSPLLSSSIVGFGSVLLLTIWLWVSWRFSQCLETIITHNTKIISLIHAELVGWLWLTMTVKYRAILLRVYILSWHQH